MCGICGALVFDNSNFAITENYVVKMRDTMIHRGPDDAGLWISQDRKIGLGHRRLSIIDLSPNAKQPMCNEDGTIWISFNGEIYNYQEIKNELISIGNYSWKTDHSDTEVIIHAYEEWGIDCIQKFRGMFAFAIWDGRKNELWLVRDRIGIKPLYYSVHNGRITFASEIKALLTDPRQKREMDEVSIYNYLSFLTTPPPATMFKGIKKLAGGTLLRIKRNGMIYEKRYWDMYDNTNPLTNVSDDEIAKSLIDELRTSVRIRKVSDVPFGVFLSGGIDSSTNAALFSEGEVNPINTFTIGYKGDYKSYKNENAYAKMMADLVGANYHEVLLDVDDLLRFLPRMIYLQDEPIADPVCVPLYYVSRLARVNGVIVCQVGEGSDELFWGYPYWKTMLEQQESYNKYSVPTFLKKAYMTALKLTERDEKGRYEGVRRSINNQPVFWGGAEAFFEAHKMKMLSERMRKKFNNYTSWEAIAPIYSRFQEKAWEKSTLNWMSYLDLNFRLPDLLLTRVDKMSMGVSLESRVPFLDHKFVEMAMSIPSAVKTRNKELKYILKKAVRGMVPDSIIERKKQGFDVPLHEWLFEKLGAKADAEIRFFVKETDLFDPDYIEKLLTIDLHRKKKWYLLNLALWWKKYIYDDASDQAENLNFQREVEVINK